MWLIIFLIIIWIILIFGFVVFFGAPYLPTLSKQKKAALDLLDLRPGETLLELGSGDGRMLIAAAERGLNAIGYELNPLLVMISYVRSHQYRKQIRIIWGNFWWQTLPRADGVYVFLLDRYMEKLNKKIIQNYPERDVKLASLAFKVPNKKISKENSGVYLYIYSKE